MKLNEPILLYEAIKNFGLFSSDIKTSVANKQIKLNDKILTLEDIRNIKIISFDEAGEFIFQNIELFRNLRFLDIDEIFECDIPSVRKHLNGFHKLRINKKLSIIISLF